MPRPQYSSIGGQGGFADACFACGFCHKATVGLCFILLLHCSTDGSIIDFAFPDLKQVGLRLCTTVIGGHSPHDSEIVLADFLSNALRRMPPSALYTIVAQLSAPSQLQLLVARLAGTGCGTWLVP